jgi:hypothetical protein
VTKRFVQVVSLRDKSQPINFEYVSHIYSLRVILNKPSKSFIAYTQQNLANARIFQCLDAAKN